MLTLRKYKLKYLGLKDHNICNIFMMAQKKNVLGMGGGWIANYKPNGAKWNLDKGSMGIP